MPSLSRGHLLIYLPPGSRVSYTVGEAGPSCHEPKRNLLVISLPCAHRSADLAAWGARAVDIDVGCSFTHCLHDFCKVRARRNALNVGSNYIDGDGRLRYGLAQDGFEIGNSGWVV